MSSDNGKSGEVDWYDVYAALEYLNRKYAGSTELNISAALETPGSAMLLCASFVGNEPLSPRGTARAHVVPFTAGSLRKVPSVAHELLLEMQEELDSLKSGGLVVHVTGV